jgi:biopolymer transport protein ExbB
MGHLSFMEMLKISIAMPILLVLSVLLLAQALERLYVFWFAETLPTRVYERVKDALERGDKNGALAVARHAPGLMAQAILHLLLIPHPNAERLVEGFQLYRQRLQLDLTRRVGFFGTASFIAPLIGLMGTVLGIMRAFHDLSVAGAGGPGVVAAGISEALVATAAGIGVAVVSAVLYNYFTLTTRHRLSTVDLWVFELAHLLEEAPESGKPVS